MCIWFSMVEIDLGKACDRARYSSLTRCGSSVTVLPKVEAHSLLNDARAGNASTCIP